MFSKLPLQTKQAIKNQQAQDYNTFMYILLVIVSKFEVIQKALSKLRFMCIKLATQYFIQSPQPHN